MEKKLPVKKRAKKNKGMQRITMEYSMEIHKIWMLLVFSSIIVCFLMLLLIFSSLNKQI